MTTISEQQHMDSLRLDTSWQWLCQTRKSAPENADIWDLRYRWPAYRDTFLAQLQSGEYRLSPMRVVGYERLVIWSAEDALALKWVALQLVGEIPLHEKCEHLKGHGGGQASVQQVQTTINTKAYRWVCRTDLKGYYGAINMDTLLLQLTAHIARPALLSLLRQFLHYSVEEGGSFHTPSQGIARSCPLMGALHLWVVDHYFATQEKIYFEKHPEKTFIDRIGKGFDWMGTWLTDKGVIDNAPRVKANNQEKLRRVPEYKKRWERWFGNDGNQKNINHSHCAVGDNRTGQVSGYRPIKKKRAVDGYSSVSRKIGGILLGISVVTFISPVSAANNFTGTYLPGHGIVGSDSPLEGMRGRASFPCRSRHAGVVTTSNTGANPSRSGWGISSDGLYHGIILGNPRSDVLLVYTGTLEAENPTLVNAMEALGTTSSTYRVQFAANGAWSANAPSTFTPATATMAIDIAPVGIEAFWSSEPVASMGKGSMSIRLYIGPKAEAGTYNIPGLQAIYGCGGDITGSYTTASTVTVGGRVCTVSISPVNVSVTGGRPQNGVGELIDSGAIQVRGNCLNGDSSTSGNMQFSIVTDNRTTSPSGSVDRALALINNDSLPVGSVTFHLSNIADPLLLTGAEYNVPVTWANINFDVLYNMYNLKSGETPAYGIGRGTAKFLVEWP